jgi:ATP-dependent exoDNAse (exonuclease V) beta subunit
VTAQQRIRDELDRSFMVEASAGTGKTTSLVHRVAAAIAHGADVRRIVAVTFTDRAASELKLRVRSELERRAREPGPDAERFHAAAEHLEEAHVSTIHHFAGNVLRRYPLEAGLDPLFRVLPLETGQRLREEAFERVLDGLLAVETPALSRYFARRDASLDALRRAASALLADRSMRGRWQRRALEIELRPESIVARMRELVGRMSARSERARLFMQLSRFEEVVRRHDTARLTPVELEADLVSLSDDLTRLDRFRRAQPSPDEEARALVVRLLERYREAANADLAADLRDVLDPVVDEYQRLKAERGELDFDDLLTFARDLVVHDARIARELGARFTHIFVDEFQDTDRVQAELLMAIARDATSAALPPGASPLDAPPAPGKLFIVGDPKQSIYRFRNADPTTYDRVKRTLLASGGDVLVLGTSYRTTRAIAAFVNYVFQSAMVEDSETAQPGYRPLEALREGPPGQPGVVALPVPRPYGKKQLSKDAVSRSLPVAIADAVAYLLEGPLRIEDPRTGALRPILAQDVAILFRQIVDWGENRTTVVSEALSARGIPHIALGGVGLGERAEAHALVTALSAIEDPRDALLVYATLKGLLFGLSDELLLGWHLRFGGLRPLSPPITALPARFEPVAAALRLLAELHRSRNRLSPGETLQRLLDETQLLVAVGLTATPGQGFLQIEALFQRALQHERAGGISFRSFVHDLADPSQSARATADDLDQDELAGVRLLTVHRAKGLEFPVVILADPTTNLTRDAERVVDVERGVVALRLAGKEPWDLTDGAPLEEARGRAESLRCAYVAATRARDLLVVPVVTDKPSYPETGWLSLLSAAAVRGPRKRLGDYGFGGADSVLERPENQASGVRVAPGLYRMATGLDTIVLCPETLTRSVSGSGGVSASALVAKGGDVEQHARELAKLESEEQRRAAVVLQASAKTVETSTVTARSQLVAASYDVESWIVPVSTRGAGGKRFGTLVHAVLAAVPLDAGEATVRRLATTFARFDDGAPHEVEEAVGRVVRALRSSHFDLIRRASRVYREVPVTVRTPAPTVVLDGVIDLLLVEPSTLTVIDFKTDDPETMTAEARTRYASQVGLYAEALADTFPGRATRLALLYL